MPFPIHPPKQMPCPHWQHFPISPVDNKPSPFGSSSATTNCSSSNNNNASINKPPEPVSYRYCVHCKAAGKDSSSKD